MAHALTTGEKATQRKPGQWSKTYLAIPEYHTIYTARLNGVPTINDMVASISVDTEVGTRANVLPDMTLYVGTSAGAFDLGLCRIRKTPIAGTFYISETSDVVWQNDAYLTVLDDYSLWQKSLRIVSATPYMDWDVAYTDQHANFDPVPVMGTYRVAKLTGVSVSVQLGPSADTPAWVIASTIAARFWSVTGGVATFDDATAVNPIATFTAPGTYLFYCTVAAAHGKTFMGVRYVIIWDDAHPLIEHFALSNGRGNFDSGAYSFDITLFSALDAVSLRARSLVILCTEDYAENAAVTLPGQITGAENILCTGWIADVDNKRNSEFGEISFSVQSAEYWLKQIRDYPSGLEMKVGTAAAWTDMPEMTVDRACWHFLHWRSTATRVMDVLPTGDTKLATQFATSRANLWERLVTVARPTIFAGPHVDNFGRLFLEVEPQMVPEADRSFPTVMTLLDADIEGEISWVRRDVTPLSMLFLSCIAVNSTGGASSYFSMSPGHSYGHYGEEESQDNYLVASQANSNQLCGLYYGWKNNPLDNLEIKITHSLRALGLFPRQYFYYEISAVDDPRGIGFAGRLIPREVQFSQNIETGFIALSVLFEPESFEGPSVNGDIPTMEDVDFSTPDYPELFLSNFPKLPSLPFIQLPPTDEPDPDDNQPTTVILASSNFGVFYTTNFNADNADVKWYSMNNGLTPADYTGIRNLVVTPSGAVFIQTDYDVFAAKSLGGTFVRIASIANFTNGLIVGIAANPNKNETIAIIGGISKRFPYGDNSAGVKLVLATSSGIIADQIDTMRLNPQWAAGICFANNQWFVSGNGDFTFSSPVMWRFSSAGSPVDPWNGYYTPGIDAQGRSVAAAGTQDQFYYWEGAGGLYKVTADGQTFASQGLSPLNRQGISFSPTGTHGMGANTGVATPYKTTDGGTTWVTVSATVPIGSGVWENCGDNYRWVFGGGTVVRLTMDQGATIADKIGNLYATAPLINVTAIRFIQ